MKPPAIVWIVLALLFFFVAGIVIELNGGDLFVSY
jgi:hypothetical protein